MLTVPRRALALALVAALAGCNVLLDPDGVKVTTATPQIALAPATGTLPLAFSTVVGTAAPAARVVNVTNAGGGALATPTVTVDPPTASAWLGTVAVAGPAGGPYTLTVHPQLVAAGTYTATVSVACAGASNSPRTFTVNYEVLSAPPTLAVAPTSLSFAATSGGANPAAKQLTISNSGGGSLAAPAVTVTSGGAWLSAGAPVASGATYTVQVNVTLGALAPGDYTGQLSVTSAGATGSPATVPVTLTVGSGTQPTIALAPASITFDTTAGSVSDPAPQNLVVTNAGAGTLAAPTVSTPTYGANGSGWLAIDAPTGAAGGPYTIVLHAAVGALAADTYTASFTVSSTGASNSPRTYNVTFNVAARPTMSLDKTALTFTRTTNAAPASQTITLSNSGGGTLADPTLQVSYVTGSNWLNTGWAAGAAGSFTITVQPSDTLQPGTYTANLQIASAGATNTPRTVAVTYHVPGIALAPSATLTFTATQGGANPAAQNVTVSNSGGGTLATPTATVTSASPWLTIGTVTASGGSYVVPVQPVTGALTAGQYNATIDIAAAGAKNSPQTVSVTFTIGGASAPVMTIAPTSLSFTAIQGGSSPAAKNLTATNTGTGTMTAPTAAVTSAGTTWLTVGTVTGAAGGPYTIPVQVALGALTAGPHTGTVRITATGGATPATVDVAVTFDVAAPALDACLASASRQICATNQTTHAVGGLSLGAARQLSSTTRSVSKGALSTGAAPSVQSSSSSIRTSVLVPGNATP